MEHIVQFAIGIDDNKIRETLEQTAVHDIEESIKKDVLGKILHKTGYAYGEVNFKEDDLNAFARKILEDLLVGWKDDIVEKSAQYLTDYLKRTKAVKQLVEETKNAQ